MTQFTHTQTTPAINWTVNHQLNSHPVCDVVIDHNGTRQKVMPLSVDYVDANTIIVRFTAARTGAVSLGGRHTFTHRLTTGDATISTVL